MADLVITPAQVQPGAGTSATVGIFGEALVAGDVVYVKAADGNLWKTDADAAASAVAVGIMLCGGATGQKGAYQPPGGTIVIGAGASVAKGQTYVVSGNAGKIAVESDLTTGDYVTILGVGNDSDGIKLDIRASGIAHV